MTDLKKLKKESDAALIEYREARKIFLEKESIWWELRKKYEKLDYEQALVDGRTKKVKVSDTKKKLELTYDELLKVAHQLGINIQEVNK